MMGWTCNCGNIYILMLCGFTRAFSIPSSLSTSVVGDSYLFVGEDLSLTCTLREDDLQNFTAYNISFGYSDPNKPDPVRCLPGSSIQAVNRSSAVLVIRNMTVSDTGVYTCYVGSADCSDSSTTVGFSDDVMVEYPPKNVVNFTCVVYDWDVSMTCTWQPPNYMDLSNIDITLVYMGRSFSHTYLCPRQNFTSCTWSKENFTAMDQYWIEVKVRNTQRDVEVAQIFLQNSSDIVKPAPVEGLTTRTDENRPGCVSVSWQHPRVRRDKVYRVKHKEDGEQMFTILIDNLTDTTYVACGYKPYTHHVFSVESYPTNGYSGYWSDPLLMDAWVPMTAPDLGPETTNGSFFLSKCDGGRRSVMLMWKEVPKAAQNGIIDSYQIRMGEKVLLPEVGAKQHSATAKLSCNKTELKIFAHNKGGYSLQPSVMLIPPASFVHPQIVKDSFAVEIISSSNSSESQDSLNATWIVNGGAEKLNYTVFWCKGVPGSFCKGVINWKKVPESQTYLALNVSVANEYLYGISVSDAHSGFTSGIWRTGCLYSMLSGSLKIKNNQVKVEAEVEAVRISWPPIQCSYENQARVTQYAVMVCQKEHCNNTNEITTLHVSSTESSVTVSPLTANIEHLVSVQPESYDIKGEQTDWMLVTTKAPDYFPWYAVIGGLAVVVAVVILAICLYRKCKAGKERIKARTNVQMIDWDTAQNYQNARIPTQDALHGSAVNPPAAGAVAPEAQPMMLRNDSGSSEESLTNNISDHSRSQLIRPGTCRQARRSAPLASSTRGHNAWNTQPPAPSTNRASPQDMDQTMLKVPVSSNFDGPETQQDDQYQAGGSRHPLNQHDNVGGGWQINIHNSDSLGSASYCQMADLEAGRKRAANTVLDGQQPLTELTEVTQDWALAQISSNISRNRPKAVIVNNARQAAEEEVLQAETSFDDYSTVRIANTEGCFEGKTCTPPLSRPETVIEMEPGTPCVLGGGAEVRNGGDVRTSSLPGVDMSSDDQPELDMSSDDQPDSQGHSDKGYVSKPGS